jgi:DNA-binding XRE family transcriptional regulator
VTIHSLFGTLVPLGVLADADRGGSVVADAPVLRYHATVFVRYHRGVESMGQRVRRLRERQGWTARFLGDLIGAHPTTIRRIENGAIPTLAHGMGLAEAFGVQPEYIAYGKVTAPFVRPKHLRGKEVSKL